MFGINKSKKKYTDNDYMKLALDEAKKAFKEGEVPVGCVIVKDGEILALTHNLKEKNHTAIAHAELIAILEASELLQNWRLEDTTMYVTLQPCPMCMSAIEQSRISRLVIGTKDLKDKTANPQVDVSFGVLEDESSKLLKDFFKSRRS